MDDNDEDEDEEVEEALELTEVVEDKTSAVVKGVTGDKMAAVDAADQLTDVFMF